jgi:mycothiol synthase
MKPYIRSFSTIDYRAVSMLMKAAVPEVSISEEQLRNSYENRDSSVRHQRWVVDVDGDVIAYGLYEHLANTSEFYIHGAVHPDHQFKGIGTALYQHIIADLSQFHPLLVQAYALENKSRSIVFLKARGFQETQPDQDEYSLFFNIETFETPSSSILEEQLQEQRVMIKTLKELQAEASFADKLYELYHELIQQTHSSQPIRPKSYFEFVSDLKSPDLLTEAYNIALREGEYIGMNMLHQSPVPQGLFNEFTGVKQAYRRMGIATALKLRGIAYAKTHGYSTITTKNNLLNQRMFQLNKRLGFVALIKFAKVFY